MRRLVSGEFFPLAVSQLLQRVFGLAREALIAVFFKVSEQTNFFFTIKAVNDASIFFLGSNSLGSVFIPRLKRDEAGKVLASEIYRMRRLGRWIAIGAGPLLFLIQLWTYLHNGLHHKAFGWDILWSMVWLDLAICLVLHNVFLRLLLQAVGDFKTLASNSLWLSFGLVIGPLFCGARFGFAGISLVRVAVMVLVSIGLHRAIRRNLGAFSEQVPNTEESEGIGHFFKDDWPVVVTNILTSNMIMLWIPAVKMCLGGRDETTYFTYVALVVNGIYAMTCIPLAMILLPRFSSAQKQEKRPNLERMGWQILAGSLVITLAVLPFVPLLEYLLVRLLHFKTIHAQGVAQMLRSLVWTFPGSALLSLFSQVIYARRGRANLHFNIVSLASIGLFCVVLTLRPDAAVLGWGSGLLFGFLGATSFYYARRTWRVSA